MVADPWHRGLLFFGSLSDRIGRKPIIPCRLPDRCAHLQVRLPAADADREPRAVCRPPDPVTVTADPENCSFQFNPVGHGQVHQVLRHRQGPAARGSVNYETVPGDAGFHRFGQDRRNGDRLL